MSGAGTDRRYVADRYDSMHGASSMLTESDDADGEFLSKILSPDGFKLTEAQKRRTRRNQPPLRKGEAGYADEPQVRPRQPSMVPCDWGSALEVGHRT